MEFCMEVLKESCTSVIYILLIVIGAFAVHYVSLLCDKLGININISKESEIINIIKNVIKIIDERYVDKIKLFSDNGKLTDYQKDMIQDKAINIALSLLTNEQCEYLKEKYQLEDIDEIILSLIDANIKETRIETENEIDEFDLLCDKENDYNEASDENVAGAAEITKEQLESLKECPGNCKYCTFNEECDISRY